MTDSFPRQQARTQRFSLGVPRSFRISPDGRRVAFLRSKTGTDPVNCLWQLHLDSGQEELVADPATLDQDEADLPAAERARRERAREQAGGITAFATDSELNLAVFALGGRAYLAHLTGPEGPASPAGSATPASPSRDIGARSPVLDPRPDPAGRRVGYVTAGALHVIDLATGEDTVLAEPGGAAGLSFGLAEFVAAEEMGRMRGYWWAPDGSAVSLPGWTKRRCSSGSSPTRPTRTAHRPRSATRRQAPPTPTSRCCSPGWTAARWRSAGTGPPSPTW